MNRSTLFTLVALLLLCAGCDSQPRLRVALVQSDFVWGDVDANLAAAEAQIALCTGADMVIFPELFTSGCDMERTDRAIKNARKDNISARYDEIVAKMLGWAQSANSAVVGSTIFKDTTSNLYYNRLVVALPSGEHYIYDKRNCYAKGSFTAGESELIFEWRGVRFATYICYDLRFSEWSRNELHRYDAAIYIANWSNKTQEAWNSLLRERAIENSAYVIGVNCTGDDGLGHIFMGDSQVVTPNGEVGLKLPSNQSTIQFFDIPRL